MRLTTLPPTRIAEACTVLGEAFADEPVASRMIPHHLDNRVQRLAAYFRWSILYMGLENVDVAIDPVSGRILAAAIGEPPAHKPHRWRAALTLPAVFKAMGRHGFRVLRDFDAVSAAAHAADPHWCLVDIGASNAARGTGAGSALLKKRLSEIDTAGLPTELEATTDRSAALYEKFGFVRGAMLTGVAEGAVIMRREPHITQ